MSTTTIERPTAPAELDQDAPPPAHDAREAPGSAPPVFGAGVRFGRLLLKRSYRAGRRIRWECLCDCGQRHDSDQDSLRAGFVRSCGCLRRETTAAKNRTHGLAAKPEHRIWRGMLNRCINPNRHNSASYVGKGIQVCARWRSFAAFYADMGPRPSPDYTLERVDNDAGYEPGNCVWATRAEQCRRLRQVPTCRQGVAWVSLPGITRGVATLRLATSADVS